MTIKYNPEEAVTAASGFFVVKRIVAISVVFRYNMIRSVTCGRGMPYDT